MLSLCPCIVLRIINPYFTLCMYASSKIKLLVREMLNLLKKTPGQNKEFLWNIQLISLSKIVLKPMWYRLHIALYALFKINNFFKCNKLGKFYVIKTILNFFQLYKTNFYIIIISKTFVCATPCKMRYYLNISCIIKRWKALSTIEDT